jgi:hypothetical protein
VLPDGTSLAPEKGDVTVRDVDVIVFATGFDLTAPLAQFEISNGRGQTLSQVLAALPQVGGLWLLLCVAWGAGHACAAARVCVVRAHRHMQCQQRH